MASYRFDAIGTSWKIDIRDPLSQTQEEDLFLALVSRIAMYDQTYSRFRDDSLVGEMSRNAGTYKLPDDSEKLFSLYRKIYDLTRGKVTPLIGSVLVAAGYDAAYTLQQREELISPPPWDDVFSFCEKTIIMHRPMILDIGAGGKGHLIDIIGELLVREGIGSYVIDAGGDILEKNSDDHTIRVGLEHPRDATQVIGVAQISNQSICGSAGNRRVWNGFHHIIDPFLLKSPTDLLAVWVVADSAFVADILTTALFFVSPEVLMPHFDFSYILVLHDGSFTRSAGFPAEFFV